MPAQIQPPPPESPGWTRGLHLCTARLGAAGPATLTAQTYSAIRAARAPDSDLCRPGLYEDTCSKQDTGIYLGYSVCGSCSQGPRLAMPLGTSWSRHLLTVKPPYESSAEAFLRDPCRDHRL